MDKNEHSPTPQFAVDDMLKPVRSTRAERAMRLLDAGDLVNGAEPGPVLYAHTVFCQTGLPYRNPGNIREWERVNGVARLKVLAGEAMHPRSGQFVQLGLPFGSKPRLILAHLNGEALRQQSPEVEIDNSLTAFVKRLHLDPGGRTIGSIKDQLARLSASSIRLGYVRDGRAVTINSQIVSAFDLWFPKIEGQRVLWPSTVRLSADYFDSLMRHAVPLHETALAALSGNAMALDIYAWLAQRLHRVDPARPALVPWPALQAQFGWHYDRLTNFRPVFRKTLGMVISQYRAARVDLDSRGLMLLHSPTPVKGRTAIMVRKD
ncbi:replication protein RepA [Acidiphilium acidophilum]|uniref:replication protein RepA n=1 Tax=Acidiphilium acidophilum TaxID=76588 RepID=UPI002E8E653C|nr:replication protein RepA [Acidiphilium acidophilum]